MPPTLTLDDAQSAIRAGAFYGDVYGRLAEADRERLAKWFNDEPGVPNRAARKRPKPETTGETCKRCGGFLVRTGTCYTCSACGTSDGGCG